MCKGRQRIPVTFEVEKIKTMPHSLLLRQLRDITWGRLSQQDQEITLWCLIGGCHYLRLQETSSVSLWWRHNERDSVSNHQPHDCLLNRLFRRTSKKTSKLRVTGLCAGNSPVTGEFPAQMASYAENVSIWWRHHGTTRNVTVVGGMHIIRSLLNMYGMFMICP